MDVNKLLDALHKKLSTEKNDAPLSEKIGVNKATLVSWKEKGLITESQLANAWFKSRAQAQRSLRHGMIKPIVEFYQIEKENSKHGASKEIFPTKENEGDPTLYQTGLREALNTRGLYIFYDSRGCALYAGKAKDQTLWKEMKNAYNRIKEQAIFKVSHPTTNKPFQLASDQHKKIRPLYLHLHDFAVYFSAYDVEYEMIDELEAFLIRGFPNDLLNVRMETLGKERKNDGK
jgi:hypothetical protein